MTCMTKPTGAVYASSSSGVSDVCWDKRRNKWHATIIYCQVDHFLGYFEKKEDAIKARVDGEKKYFEK